MQYVEMTIEEALKKLDKNKRVLVAIQDLTDDNADSIFVSKSKNEYPELFDDVQTVAAMFDDFAKQLRLFTAKQNIYHIEPRGIQKTVLFVKG